MEKLLFVSRIKVFPFFFFFEKKNLERIIVLEERVWGINTQNSEQEKKKNRKIESWL